ELNSRAELLRVLGLEVAWRKSDTLGEGGTVELSASGPLATVAPYDLVRKMRASFFVLGPLLARARRARVSLPGGCAIGARPVDLHISGIRALGARVQLKNGYVEAHADRLHGARIWLDAPSVRATENIMMAPV